MAELHGVSSCVFWAEGRRLELIVAAEGEGVLFPRAEGSILILFFFLLGIGSTLGQGCGLQKLEAMPIGLGWVLQGLWASPLRWCFYSIRIVDSAPTTADLSPLD